MGIPCTISMTGASRGPSSTYASCSPSISKWWVSYEKSLIGAKFSGGVERNVTPFDVVSGSVMSQPFEGSDVIHSIASTLHSVVTRGN